MSIDVFFRLLKRILFENNLLERILADEECATKISFILAWRNLSPVVRSNNPNIVRKHIESKIQLKLKKQLKESLLDIICVDNEVFLSEGKMRFPDRGSLWTLLHEILINEDYYFETDTDSPRILDCGTHFGLAIYYFKTLYPKARITGFEPVPEIFELAEGNIRRNNYHDVEILPYALSATSGKTTFRISNSYSMAGSLLERRRHFGDDIIEITVECHKLSDYLKEPVHFLKIDIEGVEDMVLDEAESSLSNVQHIFCEYHHGMGLESDRLGKILLLLDNNGFDAHVSKSFNYQKSSMKKPFTFVNEPYSAVIWAKNKNW